MPTRNGAVKRGESDRQGRPPLAAEQVTSTSAPARKVSTTPAKPATKISQLGSASKTLPMTTPRQQLEDRDRDPDLDRNCGSEKNRSRQQGSNRDIAQGASTSVPSAEAIGSIRAVDRGPHPAFQTRDVTDRLTAFVPETFPTTGTRVQAEARAQASTRGPSVGARNERRSFGAVTVTEHAVDLRRRGLRLEYATLAWNVVGSVLVLAAAVTARSVALAGFGLDSLIEIVASPGRRLAAPGNPSRRTGASRRFGSSASPSCCSPSYVAAAVDLRPRSPKSHSSTVRCSGLSGLAYSGGDVCACRGQACNRACARQPSP